MGNRNRLWRQRLGKKRRKGKNIWSITFHRIETKYLRLICWAISRTSESRVFWLVRLPITILMCFCIYENLEEDAFDNFLINAKRKFKKCLFCRFKPTTFLVIIICCFMFAALLIHQILKFDRPRHSEFRYIDHY